MKEIIKLGNVAKTGEHQSGIVLSSGGAMLTEYSAQWRDPIKTVRYFDCGGIGNNERENRDSKRVLVRFGTTFCLKSHISVEPPLVIKRKPYGNLERH